MYISIYLLHISYVIIISIPINLVYSHLTIPNLFHVKQSSLLMPYQNYYVSQGLMRMNVNRIITSSPT